MKLQKKTYATLSEKRKDFAIGVAVFLGLNVLLIYGIASLFPNLPAQDNPSGSANVIAYFVYALPFLANLGLLVYFALSRSWIALGMLGVIGFFLALIPLLGIIFSVVCLATGGFGI